MVAAARRGLSICLRHVGAGGAPGELAIPGLRHGQLADCVLLKAALQDPELAAHPAVEALGRRLLGLLRADGRIAQRRVRLGDGQDHEYLPAAVLYGYRTVRRAVGDAAAPRRTQAAASAAARPLPSRPRVVDGRLASAGLGGDPPHQPRSGRRGSRLRDRGLGRRPPADEERRDPRGPQREGAELQHRLHRRRHGVGLGDRAARGRRRPGPNETRTRGAGRPASSARSPFTPRTCSPRMRAEPRSEASGSPHRAPGCASTPRATASTRW